LKSYFRSWVEISNRNRSLQRAALTIAFRREDFVFRRCFAHWKSLSLARGRSRANDLQESLHTLSRQMADQQSQVLSEKEYFKSREEALLMELAEERAERERREGALSEEIQYLKRELKRRTVEALEGEEHLRTNVEQALNRGLQGAKTPPHSPANEAIEAVAVSVSALSSLHYGEGSKVKSLKSNAGSSDSVAALHSLEQISQRENTRTPRQKPQSRRDDTGVIVGSQKNRARKLKETKHAYANEDVVNSPSPRSARMARFPAVKPQGRDPIPPKSAPNKVATSRIGSKGIFTKKRAPKPQKKSNASIGNVDILVVDEDESRPGGETLSLAIVESASSIESRSPHDSNENGDEKESIHEEKVEFSLPKLKSDSLHDRTTTNQLKLRSGSCGGDDTCSARQVNAESIKREAERLARATFHEFEALRKLHQEPVRADIGESVAVVTPKQGKMPRLHSPKSVKKVINEPPKHYKTSIPPSGYDHYSFIQQSCLQKISSYFKNEYLSLPSQMEVSAQNGEERSGFLGPFFIRNSELDFSWWWEQGQTSALSAERVSYLESFFRRSLMVMGTDRINSSDQGIQIVRQLMGLWNAMALAHFTSGDAERGENLFERAVLLTRGMNDFSGGSVRAWALNNHAWCHTLKGHYSLALKCLADACDSCRRRRIFSSCD